MSEVLSQRKLIPVPQWPKYHEYPSVAGLRSLIFFSKENGFEKCLRRIGRRVLIDEGAFFTWVDEAQKNCGGVK